MATNIIVKIWKLFICLAILEVVSAEIVTINGGWSPWSKLETDCVKVNDTTGTDRVNNMNPEYRVGNLKV